ncbi:transcription factor IIIb subunit [Cryptosporidium bovis]|uniref:transcription factor IIIb subunit n=1 Tax=Cryptosporidium bovis TaxID=310047 RepID=UPI00351A52BA|nr:transcription factor IIIb subunit [Cryptosporidium bovis]
MSQRTCPQCSSTSIEVHEGRGETICTNCGTVLEESTMVEGLQFSECSNGSMQMVGHFVPSSGVRGFALVYGSRESREHVLQRGYHNLQRIADQLRLSSSHIESAQRVFLMAVQRSFTIGRNNLHVASACLYAICRREKTPHMLIDFSDVLQTPVKVLGQVFMKLLRLLRLHVPNIDPSMFMERFAAQMNLGDKTHMVAATGVRIVQALTRNWITTGRRPTGLCGAALLISARYHGIPVSSTEISQIVRISSPTLLKRLAEFKHTSTAQLTADEFENVDLLSLPIMRGPPCFEKHRLKNKNKLQAISEEEKLAITEEKNERGEKAVENELVDDIFRKQNGSDFANIDNTSFEYPQYDDENLDEIDKEGKVGYVRDGSDGHAIEGGFEEFSKEKLSFPKFLGGIELDINQDKLCEDEPTSRDITVIASKLINAFDKAKESATKSTLNTKNKISNGNEYDNEFKCTNNNEKQDSCKNRNSDEDVEDNLIIDPLHFLFKDLSEYKLSSNGSEDYSSQKSFIFAENNSRDIFSVSDVSTTISSTSNGNRDDMDELDKDCDNDGGYGDIEDNLNKYVDFRKSLNLDDGYCNPQESLSSSDDLSEISDSEINDLLLDEDEKEAKRLLWDEITMETLPPSWLRKISKGDSVKENTNKNEIIKTLNNMKTDLAIDIKVNTEPMVGNSNQDETSITRISMSDFSDDEKDKTNLPVSKKRKKDTQSKESSKMQKLQPGNAIESVLMALKKTSPGATKHVNSDTLSKLFTVF